MKEEKLEKMLLVTMIASIVNVLFLTLSFFGVITGNAILELRTSETPICLWQHSGPNVINHLETNADMCARLFERYSVEGQCSDTPGTLTVTDQKGNQIQWNYDSQCYIINGAKRFTVLSGYMS